MVVVVAVVMVVVGVEASGAAALVTRIQGVSKWSVKLIFQ